MQLKDLTLAEQLRHKKAVKTRLDRFRNETQHYLMGSRVSSHPGVSRSMRDRCVPRSYRLIITVIA